MNTIDPEPVLIIVPQEDGAGRKVNIKGRRDDVSDNWITQQEVGWDSEKAGYDGLIDVANRLMVARSNSETQEAAVCVCVPTPKIVKIVVSSVTSTTCQGRRNDTAEG